MTREGEVPAPLVIAGLVAALAASACALGTASVRDGGVAAGARVSGTEGIPHAARAVEPAPERGEVVQLLPPGAAALEGGVLSDVAVLRLLDAALTARAGTDFPLDALDAWFGEASSVAVVTDGEPGPVARALAGRLALVVGEENVALSPGPAASVLRAPGAATPAVFVLRPRWDGEAVRIAAVDPADRDSPWPVFADLVGRAADPHVGTLLAGTHDAVVYASTVTTEAFGRGALPDAGSIAHALEVDAGTMVWERIVVPRR